MIINSLLYTNKILSEILKEVKFLTTENHYRGLYSQSYAKGLSNVEETIFITMVNLTLTELTDLENLFLQQDSGKFIGYIPPNETLERPFYAPSTWDKEEITIFRGGASEIMYKLTFTLVNYA